MDNKNEDSILEASLNFAQNALKLFKQIGCNSGELYADKFENSLKKKMNTQDKGFKSAQYYIEKSKKAQKEISMLKKSSWMTDEHALLLEIVLDDVSHLDPHEQHQIKKINGTLVKVRQSHRHRRVTSKNETSFETKHVYIKSSEKQPENSSDKKESNSKNRKINKPSTNRATPDQSKLSINVRIQPYRPTTPFKDNRTKAKTLQDQSNWK